MYEKREQLSAPCEACDYKYASFGCKKMRGTETRVERKKKSDSRFVVDYKYSNMEKGINLSISTRFSLEQIRSIVEFLFIIVMLIH